MNGRRAPGLSLPACMQLCQCKRHQRACHAASSQHPWEQSQVGRCKHWRLTARSSSRARMFRKDFRAFLLWIAVVPQWSPFSSRPPFRVCGPAQQDRCTSRN